MGVFSMSSNRKKKIVHKKGYKYKRVQRAERRKQKGGPMTGEIADPVLITDHMLRKRRTSPRANITLSGKKKRKLMKQLKHMQADKVKLENAMDVEVVKPVEKKSEPNKEKTSKPKKEKKKAAGKKAGKKVATARPATEGAGDDEEWEDEEMAVEEES